MSPKTTVSEDISGASEQVTRGRQIGDDDHGQGGGARVEDEA